MARYKIECCQDCATRHPGCHSECEKYKTERAELDETLAEAKKKHHIKTGLNGFLFDSIYKTNRKRNYRNKYRRSR